MTWKEYIKTNQSFLWSYLLGTVLYFFVSDSLWSNRGDIFFLWCCLTLPLSLSFFRHYFRQKRYYQEMDRRMKECDKPYLMGELTSRPTFFAAKKTNDYLEEMTENYHTLLAKERKEKEEYYNYIQLWVHEIKLPLASLQLLCENEHLTKENVYPLVRRMNFFVEQTLFCAKGTFVHKDYHIQTYDAVTLLQESIQDMAFELIQAGFSLQLPKNSFPLRTDKQWIQFIIKQILQNSWKYRSKEQPTLTFVCLETKKEQQIQIIDNGVGISAKDLPHIFEKGYTGEKGRQTKSATGLGLYLCEQLAEQLNIKITADSEVEKGTTITLHFPIYQRTTF